MGDNQYDEQIQLEENVAEPPKYKVILLNDNYTTFEFVISVLLSVFKKSQTEAVKITMDVHNNGSGLCGIYTKEIAETKVAAVHELSEAAGFPLRCIMEEL